MHGKQKSSELILRSNIALRSYLHADSLENLESCLFMGIIAQFYKPKNRVQRF